MIVYFADQQLVPIGAASTGLPRGVRLREDKLKRTVEGGVAEFEGKLVPAPGQGLADLERLVAPVNHILAKMDGAVELFTIIDTRYENDGEIWFSAESGGLELLNHVLLPLANTAAHTFDWYAERILADTGFTVGTNEVPTLTRTITFDSAETAVARLQKLAEEFEIEIDYSFEASGMTITGRHVNARSRIGKDIGLSLRLGREVDSIQVSRSAAGLATALYPTSGEVTLSGATYDDGDIFVDGVYLKSRDALANWAGVGFGHIVKQYSGSASDRAGLLTESIRELKAVRNPETTYDVKLAYLPPNAAIGDTVHLIDEKNGLYLASRIVELTTSESLGTREATLGEITEET